ncbi:MAG: arginine repressor [Clostridiales bacterium]|nr:arginine repressor [Clostridiales bacterium]
MIKSKRHKIIREIIESKNIETQLQLTDELRKHDFNVTQATVSRDTKELGLVKVAFDENTFRYSFPAGIMAGGSLERAKKMLNDNVTKMDISENLVVVRTYPGMAQGVASAIDGLNWKEIIGTVAGDDTVFVAVRSKNEAPSVADKLKNLA